MDISSTHSRAKSDIPNILWQSQLTAISKIAHVLIALSWSFLGLFIQQITNYYAKIARGADPGGGA